MMHKHDIAKNLNTAKDEGFIYEWFHYSDNPIEPWAIKVTADRVHQMNTEEVVAFIFGIKVGIKGMADIGIKIQREAFKEFL